MLKISLRFIEPLVACHAHCRETNSVNHFLGEDWYKYEDWVMGDAACVCEQKKGHIKFVLQ